MAIGDKNPFDAIKKTLAENPVLKWAVIGLVAIFAVEFLAKEGIGIWKEVSIARLEVEAKNAENKVREANAVNKLPYAQGTSKEEDEKASARERRRIEEKLSGGEVAANDPAAKARQCALRKKFAKGEARPLDEIAKECTSEAAPETQKPALGLAASLTKEEAEAANKVTALGTLTLPHAVDVDVKEFSIKPDKTQIALVLLVANRHDEPIRLGDMFYSGYRVLNNTVFTVHPDYPERLINYNGLIFKTLENPVIPPGERLQYTVFVVNPPLGMVEAIEKDGGLNVGTLYFYSPTGMRLRAYVAAQLK